MYYSMNTFVPTSVKSLGERLVNIFVPFDRVGLDFDVLFLFRDKLLVLNVSETCRDKLSRVNFVSKLVLNVSETCRDELADVSGHVWMVWVMN